MEEQVHDTSSSVHEILSDCMRRLCNAYKLLLLSEFDNRVACENEIKKADKLFFVGSKVTKGGV